MALFSDNTWICAAKFFPFSFEIEQNLLALVIEKVLKRAFVACFLHSCLKHASCLNSLCAQEVIVTAA